MEHAHPTLAPILILLFSGIIGILVSQRLKQSPVIGFFLAGVLVGPFGFGWVPHNEALDLLAEVGVAFLLFDIGIHLSAQKLWDVRQYILRLAPLQIALSTLLLGGTIYGVFHGLLGSELPWTTALILGAGLSLSSTAVVLQVLKERGEQGSPLGQSSVAILIVQDLFVVFLLLLIPALANGGENLLLKMAITLGNVLLALAAVTVIGRYLLRPTFDIIVSSKNDEVFTASALLFVLATAWFTTQLGLSLPFGAFLAGIALSESDYCYLVKTEIYPFRSLLLGLFFITVGMTLNIEMLTTLPGVVLLSVAAILLVKILATFLAGKASGFCHGYALRQGFLLSQGSEFGFILFGLAAAQGLLEPTLAEMLMLSIGITLALTPALAALGNQLARYVEPCPIKSPVHVEWESSGLKVLMLGFPPLGQTLARLFSQEGIEYVAFTSDRQYIAEMRSAGFQVEYGDIDRPRGIGATHTSEASLVINMVDDDELSNTITRAIRDIRPDVTLYTVVWRPSQLSATEALGPSKAYLYNEDTAEVLIREILRQHQQDEETIDNRIARMRREDTQYLVNALT